MKIEFEDKSYIEIKKNNDKIFIIISAKDHQNNLKNIINAVELTLEEYNKLISDIK